MGAATDPNLPFLIMQCSATTTTRSVTGPGPNVTQRTSASVSAATGARATRKRARDAQVTSPENDLCTGNYVNVFAGGRNVESEQ